MTIETMEFKEDGGPRYKQVADAIEGRIADGSLSGGSKLPTHRALADRLGVTIGTITRATTKPNGGDWLKPGSRRYLRLPA